MIEANGETFLTAGEVIREYDLSYSRIYRLTRSGDLIRYRIPLIKGHPLYKRSEVDHLLGIVKEEGYAQRRRD